MGAAGALFGFPPPPGSSIGSNSSSLIANTGIVYDRIKILAQNDNALKYNFLLEFGMSLLLVFISIIFTING
jgi:hypothetical protein